MNKAYYPKIIVNHVGYKTGGGKFFVAEDVGRAVNFELIDMNDEQLQKPCYKGTLHSAGNELGGFLTGDFSDFQKAGAYRVRVFGTYDNYGPYSEQTFYSHNFTISDNVYDPVIEKLLDYYRAQSCGPSERGYNTPCHDGPIARDDGGEARVYLGGWHSAHDHQRDPDETMNGAFGLMYLIKARPEWLASLQKYAKFIKENEKRNAFGILPSRFFAGTPPQTARRYERTAYRYFMETNYLSKSGALYWQTGNTGCTAGYGTAMLYLADILDDMELRYLAARQLDWIMGINPFDASMIWGVGRNTPPCYPSKDFYPPVPELAGAVYEGPTGDQDDNPIIIPGFYGTCEYWMPHQSLTLWLMAELSADTPQGP